jgi:cell division protein ZapE
LFGKAFAAPASGSAQGRVFHDYFHHKAHARGYTLSHSQQRVIDCMAQHASALLGASAPTLPGLYLYGAVGRGKSWLLDGFFQGIPIVKKQRLHFHEFFAHQSLRESLGGDAIDLARTRSRLGQLVEVRDLA